MNKLIGKINSFLHDEKFKKFIRLFTSNFPSNRAFFRLLLSYVFVLLIPILTSWLAYGQAIRDVEQYTKESNISMLRQSCKIIDRNLDEVSRTAIQLGMNRHLKEILPKKTVNNYDLSLLLNELSSYIIPNNFVVRTGIYLKNSHYVFYSDTVYNDRFLYKHILRYQNIGFSEWRSALFSKAYQGEFLPSRPVVMERLHQSVITFIQSIPFDIQYHDNDGAIFLLIDTKQFHSLLPKIDVAKGSWVYVLDDKGQMITSIGHGAEPAQIKLNKTEGYLETSYAGKPIFVTYTTSPMNGWKYVVALPRAAVMAKVHYIKILAVVVTFISLISGFILAYFLAYKNTEPIRGIIKMISDFLGIEQENGVGEYEFLTGQVSKLISNNNSLKTAMINQSAMATTIFFERLLRGDFKNSDEVDVFSKYAGIDLHEKRFLTVILKMYGSNDVLNQEILKELDMTKVVIKDILKKVMKEDSFIHDLDENNIAILMIFSEEVQNPFVTAENLMNQIYYEVYSRYRISLNFAAGSICDHFLEISQSFEHAKDAAGYLSRNKEKKIVWYQDLPKQSEGYYYSMDLETRLMNAAKAGDLSEIQRYLRYLWDENYEKRALSPEMLHLLTWEMRGTLVKLKNLLDLKDGIAENIEKLSTSTKTFGEIFNDISSIYQSICSYVDNQKRSHNINLKNRMIEFINKAYQDASLSLSTVASKFALTESYISQFFKEQTGENFSSYLEKIRMQHACELLTESDLPINEIAQRVGYYSDQVFRRAFKRFHGVTPNEFRVLSKSEDLEAL